MSSPPPRRSANPPLLKSFWRRFWVKSLKTWKIIKGVFWYSSARPSKAWGPGHLPGLPNGKSSPAFSSRMFRPTFRIQICQQTVVEIFNFLLQYLLMYHVSWKTVFCMHWHLRKFQNVCLSTKLFLFLPWKRIIANRCPRVFLPIRSVSSFILLHDPPLRNMLYGVHYLRHSNLRQFRRIVWIQ